MGYFLKNSILACLLGVSLWAAESPEVAPSAKPAKELTAAEKAAKQRAALDRAVSARVAQEQADSDLALRITALKPSDVVLTVGDMSATWGELRPVLQPVINDAMSVRMGNKRKSLFQEVWKALVGLASRGLYLQEVNALKITLTDEDRKRLEANLVSELQARGNGVDLEKYKARMAKDRSSLVAVTFEDSMRLVLWSETLYRKYPLPEAQIDKAVNERVNYNALTSKQNLHLKESMNELAVSERAKLATDEGFFEMAKKYSEGLEAQKGGVLDADFTRESLCRINGVKEFPYKPGETTPVFEVYECYRIMRVLSVKPPTKEGEVETLRVAQILAPKYETLPVDRKQVALSITPIWNQMVLRAQVPVLSKKYAVTSPLFPDGLFPKESASDKKAAPSSSESRQKQSSTSK